MKKILFSFFAISVSACTSVKVQELNSGEHQVHHVCIEQNPKVIVERFPQVIEDGFQRHGITSEVYKGEKPSHCEYSLTYTALKTWDMGAYLHHAEMRLFKNKTKIAYAEYHLNGKGGLALNKWAGVDSKMDPVINKLLSGYSPELVNTYRKGTNKDTVKADKHSASDSDTEKLKKLKLWHSEGLITDQEYQEQKNELLNR